MSATTICTPIKSVSHKSRRHKKRYEAKRRRFEPLAFADEPWTLKRPVDYVFICSDLMREGSCTFEHAAVADESQFTDEETLRLRHSALIQMRASEFLKMMEISDNISVAIAKRTQQALQDFRKHLRMTLPVVTFHAPVIKFQLPLVRMPELILPKLTVSFAKLTTGFAFEADAIKRLLEEQLIESFSEEEIRSRGIVDTSWLNNADSLLKRLESGGLSESIERTAIAHAESVAFSCEQVERLLTFYDDWIETNRFSEDDEQITATCAAIRKYAMNMGSDRFARYASWLVPSASERVHHDVELELTKGAYWHLRYLDTDANSDLTTLQDVLADEACDYLKPRLMLDKNYTSIAKFAITACLLIDARTGNTEVSQRVWERKSRLAMGWFDRLVKFEISKATQSIKKLDTDFAGKVNELLESLDGEGE